MVFQKGHTPWHKGKTEVYTDKQKQAISNGVKKAMQRPEVQKKMRKLRSEEGKRNMSISAKSRPLSKRQLEVVEGLRQIAISRRGTKRSKEIGRKISETKRKQNFKHTKETKEKIRRAVVKYIYKNPNKRYFNTKPEIEMKKVLEELGINYMHQYPVLNIEHCYIADFYLPQFNSILEVDGKKWHNYPHGRKIDRTRGVEMRKKGFEVQRFWEWEFSKKDVLEKLDLFTLDIKDRGD